MRTPNNQSPQEAEQEGADEDQQDRIDADEDGAIRIGDIYIAPPPLPALTFDATGPRLMISDIQIENFKSYGGKVQLGPFHKNFSSIIGPNGSGKSNVIDSMLFVFGYRSQKIRSKTVGVLIHSSDTHPNVTGCSVSVHFQKIIDKSADDFEVVPNSQFVIMRSAFKDNSSYYSIDGRRVQFKEVGRLLRSHGIDIDHNRFLILQGEVEQISLMKPKGQTEHDAGLLEFLEDIIGSGRFKEPIDILAKRVEDLNQERSEKLNRVKAVEKEKDDLEGPKNEAMEYYKAKNELTTKKNTLYQRYVYDLQKEATVTGDEVKASEEALGVLIEQFKEIDAKVTQREEESGSVKEQFQESCKKVDELGARFTALELEDVHRREDLKHRKTKVKELRQLLDKESTKLESLKKEPERLDASIEEFEKHKIRLDQDKQKAEVKYNQEMTSIHSETKSLQEEKDKHEEKLIGLQKTVDETKSRMDIVKVEFDLYLKNELTEKTMLAELQHSHEQALNTVQEKQQELNEIKKTLPTMERAYQQDKSELEEVTRKEQETADQFRERRNKLEETRNSFQNSRNTSRLLQALMNEKSSGRIPGIIGRLGDLGAINAKYDIAISTACRALDNIVTDTIDTAKKCVQFLKANNLGLATFLGLEKMKQWESHTKRKMNTPENVPRLFDLIKVKDPSILPAFYFALRDTLVADDINQATRIGLQGGTRHRVVTLKGELIELSGTMTGGGGAPLKGRMGTALVEETCTQEQLEAMERNVAELQQEANRLRERKTELQEKIADHENTMSQLRHSLERNKMEISMLHKQEPALRSQIVEQEQRVKGAAPDKKKVDQLTKKLEEEKAEFDEADAKAAKVKDAIKVLHDKIVEIGGSKLKAAQKMLEVVQKKIDATVSDIIKNKATIKAVHRNLAKTEEKITSTTAEIDEHKAVVARIKQELVEADAVATEVLALSNECKAEKSRLEKIVNDIKEGLKEWNVRRHELEVQKLESKHQLNKIKIVLAEIHQKISKWKRDISKLVIEEVDGVETVELPVLTEEELLQCRLKKDDIYVLEDNLKNMKPNLSAIAEFKRKENVYLERVAELDEITKNRDGQRRNHEDLRKQRLNEFMTGFNIITYKLKETYQMLTLGGDAELELVNSLDPFSDGIVFSVRPSRKSWKNISNLSGGEKTLSSLALVFALHYYKPTPFYVMDEIDAALDFRNVSIVGHYIKEQTKNAQFIVISLRNNMFELADRLVGIFKIHNTSDSVAIDPRSQVES